MKNIIFFGNERLATGLESTTTPTLRALITNGYNIKAVVSNYKPPLSRKSRELEIEILAKTNNIPVLLPKNLNDIKQQLESYKACAGVLVAYGKIIPESIINMFEYGIINIHPSLLPGYRGPTPIEQAILDGTAKTGVSIMKLTKAMDEGPVYVQKSIKLVGDENKQELAQELLELGSNILIEYLPRIFGGNLKPRSQPHPSRATYTNKISKEEGVINWSKSADQIVREIRAYLGWPGSKTKLGGKDVTITQACVSDQQPGTGKKVGEWFIANSNKLVVQTADGLLEVEKLKPAGKNEMSGQDFTLGYLK